MPRFFFHMYDGTELVEDSEGSDLADAEAARNEALTSARELWAASILAGKDLSSYRFEISDLAGTTMLVVPFTDALPFARHRHI